MARFTQSLKDVKHLVSVQGALPIAGIVQCTLANGEVVEGVIRGASQGNNGQYLNPAAMQYYAEVTIEGLNGNTRTIDYLDIVAVADVWAQRSAAYADAGRIKIG